MAKEIPVYLFVGFLESGKTKFIQETFEDPNFDSGDKTLLLICEEGEEEYNEKKFAFPGVTVKVLEDKAELNPQNLLKLEKESGAGRVVIEYNGMWLLQDLAEALPESWIVYQCIATADGTTALTYARDNSMRSLLLDKIARSELIVFNRAEAVNNDAARQELHKLVRQASRKCDIAYEFADGSVAYDDIPDPLPFDINADIIDIPDDDFGIWYMDCQDEPQKLSLIHISSSSWACSSLAFAAMAISSALKSSLVDMAFRICSPVSSSHAVVTMVAVGFFSRSRATAAAIFSSLAVWVRLSRMQLAWLIWSS